MKTYTKHLNAKFRSCSTKLKSDSLVMRRRSGKVVYCDIRTYADGAGNRPRCIILGFGVTQEPGFKIESGLFPLWIWRL